MKTQKNYNFKSNCLVYITFLFLLLDLSIEKNDEKKKTDYNVSISFDLSDPNISIEPDDNGEIIPIENFTSPAFSPIQLPKAILKRNGDRFQGWTSDGIYGHESGETLSSGGEDLIFRPVFTLKNDSTFYKVEHLVEFNGSIIETQLKPFTKKKNSFVSMSPAVFSQPTAYQEGWKTEGHIFLAKDKMIMPGHDVLFTAVYKMLRYVIYDSGDFPGVLGNHKSILSSWEGSNYQLSDGSRLFRNGYNLKGWYSPYYDKDYEFYDYLYIPDEDIIVYAIWEPRLYQVGFSTGLNDIKSIKVPGYTDTVITVPEIPHEKEGYTFGGFKSEDGKIYYPGDNYYIEGQSANLGIGLTAIWTKDNGN